VNSSGRFTISGVGIPDVLASEPVPNLVALQVRTQNGFATKVPMFID
jgi:hypothetical protein